MRPVTGILDAQSTTILFCEIIIFDDLMSHCIWYCIWLNQIESPLFVRQTLSTSPCHHIPSWCQKTHHLGWRNPENPSSPALPCQRCTIETHGQGLPLQIKYALDMWDTPGTTPQLDRKDRKVNCAWQTLRLKSKLCYGGLNRESKQLLCNS